MEMSEQDLKDLKKAYEHAVVNKLPTFIFQERAVVTTYAKYLIEHLEGGK